MHKIDSKFAWSRKEHMTNLPLLLSMTIAKKCV